MSDLIYYPPLNEGDITKIIKLYEVHPNYFERPECPYSDEVKAAFKKTGKVHDFDTHDMDDVPASDSLLTQINQLSKELKVYGQSISNSEDTSPSDRNTYFRLSVTLLEKLVDIKEKVGKIVEYELFTNEVLDIMDKILSTDQRSEVMARLEKFVEPEIAGAQNETNDDTN